MWNSSPIERPRRAAERIAGVWRQDQTPSSRSPFDLVELRLRHPSAVDRIVSAWNRPEQAERLIDQLMFSGDAMGRPLSMAALQELTNLKEKLSLAKGRWADDPALSR
jgi:hypothetical protein